MTTLTEEKERVTRSQLVPCEKSQCIICQKIGGQLHKVVTKETGQKMLEISLEVPEKGRYRRSNSTICPGDASVTVYHNLCWPTVKKKAEAPRKTVYTNKKVIHTV